MADFISASRSNYVHVTDEALWDEWISRLSGIDDFSHVDEDGTTVHGCGCYGSPWYREDDDIEDDAYGDDEGDIGCKASVRRIQAFLPEGEAFIYMEAGWEKLRYVAGYALVVTKHDAKWVSVADAAVEAAQGMLGDPKWTTQMEY